MTVDCASSGLEAIDLVKQQFYDMIFMDHMMPDMDGVETLNYIRALPDEKYRKLPVIALTANASREAQIMFKEKGFEKFMAKPLDIEKLDIVLHKYLKK